MYLSRSDQRTAKRSVMRKMAASKKSALSFSGAAPSDGETTAPSLLTSHCEVDLAREGGCRMLNYPIILHIQDLGRDQYVVFA